MNISRRILICKNRSSNYCLNSYNSISWSIFSIGILHCLVWSLGVGEAYSQTFFSHQNLSLKAGGALNNPYSEEEQQELFKLIAIFTEQSEDLAAQQASLALAELIKSSKQLNSILTDNNSITQPPEGEQIKLLQQYNIQNIANSEKSSKPENIL